MKIKRKYFRTDLIDNYLLDNNLTKKQFCEKCKISYATLHKMYNQDASVSIISSFKVLRVMRIECYKLWV